MHSKNFEAPSKGLLFETSWEVCNKVGGIYTVLSTKAEELQKVYGDKLIFVGPDIWNENNPSPSFIERKVLLKNIKTKVELPYGISIRVGRWKVPGQPIAVLVGYKGLDSEMNNIFGKMWENYKVDSLHANGDYRESCTFAVAAAIVIREIIKHLKADETQTIAHFDEWTTGMGLLDMKLEMPSVATIFTTHATCIGRSISGNGKPLYDYFEDYNGDQMATELNMESKHSLEKAAAHQADCFTTVSQLTAAECAQLLEIRPQVVTPNGFNSSIVPAGNKMPLLRKKARSRILEVASQLTGKTFDDNTFIVGTSGRNEYRNKGLDLFIDSLAKFGTDPRTSRPVLALILVPAWVKEPSGALLDRLAQEENPQELVWPPFVTHRLNNEDADPIFRKLTYLQSQDIDTQVSFMYVPCYLDGNDGVINLSYYNVLPALDISVFPSYYEPWGYTPLESIAFGVPTIGSDKSGFGQWIESTFKNGILNCGVDVVDRTDSNYDNACETIENELETVLAYSDKQVAMASKASKATASMASWKLFINYYFEAFNYALEKAHERNK